MYVVSSQVGPDALRWERLELKVYADSQGFATQGLGQHTGVSFGDPDITEETAWKWFSESWQRAYVDAKTLVPLLDSFDIVRKEAIIWLVFNMGKSKLAQFTPFLSYVNSGQFEEAHYHLLTNTGGHLTPYLLQVGRRAVETALRISSGNILKEFRV